MLKWLLFIFLSSYLLGCSSFFRMSVTKDYDSIRLNPNNVGIIIDDTLAENEMRSGILEEFKAKGNVNPDSLILGFIRTNIPVAYFEITGINAESLSPSILNKVEMKSVKEPDDREMKIPIDGSNLLNAIDKDYVFVYTNIRVYGGYRSQSSGGNIASKTIIADSYVWDVVNKKVVLFGMPRGAFQSNIPFVKDDYEWKGVLENLIEDNILNTPMNVRKPRK